MLPFLLGAGAGVMLNACFSGVALLESCAYVSPFAQNSQNSVVALDITQHRSVLFGAYSSNYGRITIELFDNVLPVSATNFRELCRGGQGSSGTGHSLCYSRTLFTADADFVKGGDVTFGSAPGGWSIYGQYFFESPNKENGGADSRKGLVYAVARDSRVGSEFMIKVTDSTHEPRRAALGQVLDGYDVLQRMHQRCRRYPPRLVWYTVTHAHVLKEAKTPKLRKGWRLMSF
ncbi:cyclophilin-type peptidyl-prolyl cis-trans isomerase [Trypanosoma grayi]|uniref:cyclophilin-type peptidyl-prolyl cis-trans isomerase n=1 Tax=Trypanosoma grayi TaxID=71804 RepID=UPI0004F4AF0B|nr:cyclophilin-type peptidyl-prolyl cis-trans isomerase [Trypanosoma grayi]KEG07477.1 cyclophilin-type peptidyl-prolyl cis-trans isomerase [Trypanosoma grayi]